MFGRQSTHITNLLFSILFVLNEYLIFQLWFFPFLNFDYNRFKKGVAIKSSHAINALVFLKGHRCENCGLTSWMNQPISLEVHHVDGDYLNNDIDNLKLLCPNCHSLTDNYRGKNINSGIKSISDNEFVEALKNSPNIRQALKRVGLTAKGGNYQRARELILTYNIDHLMKEQFNNQFE